MNLLSKTTSVSYVIKTVYKRHVFTIHTVLMFLLALSALIILSSTAVTYSDLPKLLLLVSYAHSVYGTLDGYKPIGVEVFSPLVCMLRWEMVALSHYIYCHYAWNCAALYCASVHRAYTPMAPKLAALVILKRWELPLGWILISYDS